MAEEHPFDVALENRLMGKGIYLTRWEQEGDVVDCAYETVAEVPAVTSHEVGVVVRTLLEVADEHEAWTPITLEATSTTTDGTVRGEWRVEADWFRRLYDDLSELEFSELVLSSVENRSAREQ
ncbi:hypothetical protein [Natronobeatus ordinarius]|uniref:hypothetical protein n=1 Tax=Natronobeatus ordinarius TaxID=2963433 RepID=UPI0020CFB957|nr:hypothetical protein [Natronobeatus ordinarius]